MLVALLVSRIAENSNRLPEYLVMLQPPSSLQSQCNFKSVSSAHGHATDIGLHVHYYYLL